LLNGFGPDPLGVNAAAVIADFDYNLIALMMRTQMNGAARRFA
jgi:hypothetical protein